MKGGFEVKKFIVAGFLIMLLLCSGNVLASTCSFENMPGGAGVFMWQASATGDYTLVNVQNVADVVDTFGAATSTSIVIHITLYDRNSNHIFDWSCPLSQRDNYGFAITNDGGIDQIAITSDGTPFYIAPVGGIGNCTANFVGIAVAHNPAIGNPGALQYGYGTVAITRIDALVPAFLWRTLYAPSPLITPPPGNGNGDARDDLELANTTVVVPDLIFIRTAFLGPAYAFALNGNMLQGFLNCDLLQAENVASAPATTLLGCGWVATWGADALCGANTVDWNNNALFDAGAVPLLDFNGIDIHAPELYITDHVGAPRGIALDAAVCARGARRNSLGSSDGVYWARYNVTPGVTDTTLITVAPASNAHALNPARGIADTRDMTVSAYDDAEVPVSITPLLPPEVGYSPFLSPTNPPRPGNVSIGHGGITAGEGRIVMATVQTPLFGLVFTTISGAEADMYPLIKNQQAVNVNDLGFIVGPLGGGTNQIEYVGF
jgi:hypothetical protein